MDSNFENIFSKYRKEHDRYDSMFTILGYDIGIKDFVNEIDHHLKLINTIADVKKKHFLSDRISTFKCLISEKSDKQINSVFLIGEKTTEIKLENDWINTLRQFDISNFIFKYGSTYDIDYLKIILEDSSYKHVICLKNTIMSHIYFNPNKKKIFFKTDLSCKKYNIVEYIDKNIHEKCIIHGISSIFKGLKDELSQLKHLQHLIMPKMLTDAEITNLFKKDEIDSVHSELNKYIGYIQHPKYLHLIVFGRDIEQSISNFQLKILYCTPEFGNKVRKNVPEKFLKFKIVVVDTLKKGDSGDDLKFKYGGAIGVKYY